MFWAYWHFCFITTLHSFNFYLEIYWHDVWIKSFETHRNAVKVWNPLQKQLNNVVQEVQSFKKSEKQQNAQYIFYMKFEAGSYHFKSILQNGFLLIWFKSLYFTP